MPASLPVDGFGSLFRQVWGGGTGGAIDVYQGGILVKAGASKLNFASGATVTDGGVGQADVAVTGGGGGEDFTATCLAGVAVTQIVYLTGAPGPAVAVALAVHPGGAYPAIGFIGSKSAPTVCLVQTDGELTGFVGLVPGAVYYLSPTVVGAITNIPPVAGGQVVQKVGQAKDATTLLINLDDDFVEL